MSLRHLSGRAPRRPRGRGGVAWRGLALRLQSNIEGTPEAYADDEPAGNLYNEGLAYMNAGKLNDAVKSFNEVDRQHPYSEYARKALIMSAFASYRRGNYDDAVATAKRYLTLYPGSPDAAYAQYLIGSVLFPPDPGRHARPGADAQGDRRHAGDRRPLSGSRICRRRPARRSSSPATSSPARTCRSAATISSGANTSRRSIASRWWSPTTRTRARSRRRWSVSPRPTWRWASSREAQTAAAVLGHNFPDSPWYKDAYKLLQGGGVEPREDKGSWLSSSVRREGGLIQARRAATCSPPSPSAISSSSTG